MAKNPSILVRSDKKPNLFDVENLATGAAAGFVAGSLVPGIGNVTMGIVGAVVGAGVNSVTNYGEDQKNTIKGITYEEYKPATIFNREAMLTAGAVVLASTVVAVPFAPLVGLVATFAAGKMGEDRMNKERITAKQQYGLEDLETKQRIQATNQLPAMDNRANAPFVGGMNTVTTKEYQDMQEAQRRRAVVGKHTAAIQQRELEQQMAAEAALAGTQSAR
ncbi:MAG: hypothetical protein EAY65_00460 [Alphaproteobacteria bacterium]|nr:MAG: hypothetical protein EAY65_00460 [Alphaproteobacteria bacterium]